jgi:hypothetical protein
MVSQHRRHIFVTPCLGPTRTVDEVACMLGHLSSKAQDPASKLYKAPQQPVNYRYTRMRLYIHFLASATLFYVYVPIFRLCVVSV